MPKTNGSDPYKEIIKIDDKLKICSITAIDVYNAEIKKEFQSSSDTIILDKDESCIFKILLFKNLLI